MYMCFDVGIHSRREGTGRWGVAAAGRGEARVGRVCVGSSIADAVQCPIFSCVPPTQASKHACQTRARMHGQSSIVEQNIDLASLQSAFEETGRSAPAPRWSSTAVIIKVRVRGEDCISETESKGLRRRPMVFSREERQQ